MMETQQTGLESTVGGEIIAGMLGAGVAVACLLPPVVHLVSGPLGPLIGGFVAGNRANPGPRGQMIIAALVGSGVTALLGTAAFVLLSFATKSELPSWFPSSGELGGILAGVWVYGLALGFGGTAIARAFSKRDAKAH